MTFKERLQIEHPEHINENYIGGCNGCPDHYNYETLAESEANCRWCGGKGCEYCWSREIPGESNNINHPRRYETGQFKCIDVMIETQGVEAVKGFCKCNAFKYLYRANRKNGLEDMKKAIWYLNKYVELEEHENEPR